MDRLREVALKEIGGDSISASRVLNQCTIEIEEYYLYGSSDIEPTGIMAWLTQEVTE